MVVDRPFFGTDLTDGPEAGPEALAPIHLDRLADVMVWALTVARAQSGPGGEYQPGDMVMLPYDAAAGGLAERVYARLLKMGLYVELMPTSHFRMEQVFYEHAQADQLSRLPEWMWVRAHAAQGLIALRAPESLTYLKDCDPAKIAEFSKSRKPLRDIWNAAELKGMFGWTVTVLPTPVQAEQAQLSLDQYVDQVVKACYLDHDDPVAKWQNTMAKVDRIKDWLNSLDIDSVQVRSACGQTDLHIGLGEQRQWLGGSGRNIPSFEVFVSPEAGRAEGFFFANEPSYKLGRYVKGVRFEFRYGKVVGVQTDESQEFVQSRVDLDEGSKLVGEFSLTDRRFSQITKFMANTLYDENVGGPHGNCHIAIGNAYLDSYAGSDELTQERIRELGFSQSAEHWDLVTTDDRTVTATLKSGPKIVIYQGGQFLCPDID